MPKRIIKFLDKKGVSRGNLLGYFILDARRKNNNEEIQKYYETTPLKNCVIVEHKIINY